MNRFLIVAFFFMGLAYYELSGGSDFVPQAHADTALASAEIATPAPELTTAKATRTPTPGLAAIEDFVTPSVTYVSAPIVFDDAAQDPVAGIATASSADIPSGDIWTVTADRLNVRQGPSTGDAVVGQVTGGEEVTVVSADAGDGWVMIRIEGDGAEGWVASRFLTQ